MDLNQIAAFVDLIKDPDKYAVKIKELQTAEAAIKAAYADQAKIKNVDQLVSEANAILEKAKKDAEQLKSDAQKESAGYIQRTKEALAEAEKLKALADQQAKANRDDRVKLMDQKKQVESVQKEIDQKVKNLSDAQIMQSEINQELESRLSKLRSVMQ